MFRASVSSAVGIFLLDRSGTLSRGSRGVVWRSDQREAVVIFTHRYVCGSACESHQPSLSRWLNHDGSDLRPPHSLYLSECHTITAFFTPFLLHTFSHYRLRPHNYKEGMAKGGVLKRTEETRLISLVSDCGKEKQCTLGKPPSVHLSWIHRIHLWVKEKEMDDGRWWAEKQMGDRRCDKRGREQSRQQLLWWGADGAWWSGYGRRARSPSTRWGRPGLSPAPSFCRPIYHISKYFSDMEWRINRKVNRRLVVLQEVGVCVLDTVWLIGLGITQSLGDLITPEGHKNARGRWLQLRVGWVVMEIPMSHRRCLYILHLLLRWPQNTALLSMK